MITSEMKRAAIVTADKAEEEVLANDGWLTIQSGWIHIAKEAMYQTEGRVTHEAWVVCSEIAAMARDICERRGTLWNIDSTSQFNFKEAS